MNKMLDVPQSSPKRLRECSLLFDDDDKDMDDNDDDENNISDEELVMIHNSSSRNMKVDTNNDIGYLKPLKSSPKRTKVNTTTTTTTTTNTDQQFRKSSSSSFTAAAAAFIPHPLSNTLISQLPNISNQENIINNGMLNDPNESGSTDDRHIYVEKLYPQLFNFPHVSTIGTGLPRLHSNELLTANRERLSNHKRESDTSNSAYPPTILRSQSITTFVTDSSAEEISNNCAFVQLGPLQPLPQEFLTNPRAYWEHLQSRGWYSIKTPELMQTGNYYKDIDDDYLKKRFGSHLFLRRGEPKILQHNETYIEKIYETSEMTFNLFNRLFQEDLCFPSEDSVISYCRSTYGIGIHNFPTTSTNPTANINSVIMTFLFPDEHVDNDGDIM